MSRKPKTVDITALHLVAGYIEQMTKQHVRETLRLKEKLKRASVRISCGKSGENYWEQCYYTDVKRLDEENNRLHHEAEMLLDENTKLNADLVKLTKQVNKCVAPSSWSTPEPQPIPVPSASFSWPPKTETISYGSDGSKTYNVPSNGAGRPKSFTELLDSYGVESEDLGFEDPTGDEAWDGDFADYVDDRAEHF